MLSSAPTHMVNAEEDWLCLSAALTAPTVRSEHLLFDCGVVGTLSCTNFLQILRAPLAHLRGVVGAHLLRAPFCLDLLLMCFSPSPLPFGRCHPHNGEYIP